MSQLLCLFSGGEVPPSLFSSRAACCAAWLGTALVCTLASGDVTGDGHAGAKRDNLMESAHTHVHGHVARTQDFTRNVRGEAETSRRRRAAGVRTILRREVHKYGDISCCIATNGQDYLAEAPVLESAQG